MEEYHFTFGITLIVQGFLVSGTPISGREFYGQGGAHLGELASVQGYEAADELRKLLESYGERYHQEFLRGLQEQRRILRSLPNGHELSAEERRSVLEDYQLWLRQYIHLKDVTIVGGAGGHPVKAEMWRGRLAEVAGWHIGLL
jgi:hypothetical protein